MGGNGVRLDPTHATAERIAGRLRPRTYVLLKPAVEFVLACLLLIPATPLVLLAALLVKLTSRGPAFYAQRRLGRDCRPFTIRKIRTMVHDSERLTGPHWANALDPRTTRIGRILRWTHIDELPQLLNVLTGSMGLVGPRPERPEIVRELDRAIGRYHDRLRVRPGMTGLAQVQLPPDTDLDSVRRKLAHDLHYARHMSFWLDLRILLSTACYLLRIPFAVSNRLLALPTGRAIEEEYRRLTAEEKAVLRMQPA